MMLELFTNSVVILDLLIYCYWFGLFMIRDLSTVELIVLGCCFV